MIRLALLFSLVLCGCTHLNTQSNPDLFIGPSRVTSSSTIVDEPLIRYDRTNLYNQPSSQSLASTTVTITIQ
jgi:hypothetical protein